MRVTTPLFVCLVLAVSQTRAFSFSGVVDSIRSSVRSMVTPDPENPGTVGASVMRGLMRVQSSSVVNRLVTSLDTKTNRSEHSEAGKPKFCNDLDCPHFTIVKSTKEYEVRKYVASQWVSTGQNGIDFDAASYKMFMRLFGYISGKNEKKEKIEMTCPVLMRIIPGQGPACENNFTMSFFVSPEVKDVPKPSAAEVHLESMAAMTVYVRSFGGFADKDKWISEALALSQALPKTAAYHTEFYYTAGYDAPFKFLNRHNEIWFIGK